MKKPEVVKIEGQFSADVLRVLRDIPGLTVVPQPRPGTQRDGAVIENGGARMRVAVEAKKRVNAAGAWQALAQFRAADLPLIVVADETTAGARAILRENGVGVVDGQGNTHIELPGLLVHVEVARRVKPKATPTRLRAKAGLVAQALLLDTGRIWRVNDLAERAGVSAGLAHRVLARLGQEGVVVAEGTGPGRIRRVTNPGALLDLFTEENDERPRRTLAFLLAQTPAQATHELGKDLDRAGIQCALAGAAAAGLLAPFLTATPVVEVWVADTAGPEELCGATGAGPVTDGANVVFLQAKADVALAFRDMTKGLWVANRFRVYTDLLGDPRRGQEQAEHFREEVIGF